MRLGRNCSALLVTHGLLIVLLIVLAAAQPPSSPPDPHASGKIVVPPNTSEIAYCDGCHTKGCPMPHKEGVTLDWAATGRVVLGVNGEITCGTCHTRGFRHASDAFLARDQRGLCNVCHCGAHSIPNLHSGTQSCDACHFLAQAKFAHATPEETTAMKGDIDADCMRCHYDGPITHPINVPNSKKKAKDLPLSPDGKITCVTCHIGHKQQDRFGSMLRKDNRRGGLCNSCHDDL
jgi:hypothetical protein